MSNEYSSEKQSAGPPSLSLEQQSRLSPFHSARRLLELRLVGHTPAFHRNLDLTRFGERLGQHHVVLFGDTPVTRGIVEITRREQIETFALFQQMKSEQDLIGRRWRNDDRHVSTAFVFDRVGFIK